MNAAELPAPQLGRILIAAGLLNEEQLAQALEEQARTGRRLGEIIVQRGFISGPALANALAEQHGGVLKTEYGFASGLGGVAARRAASEAGTTVSPLRPPDPTPISSLRTAESPTPVGDQDPAAQEEPAEPTPLQQAPLQSPEPPEPAEAPEAPESAEPPEAAPALLRPAEPPAETPEEPSEPVPSLLTAPSPPEPVEPPPPALEHEPTPPVEAADAEPERDPIELHPPAEPAQHVIEPEPEVDAPAEPEPTPPAEAPAPLPQPVELRPQLPEPEPVPPAKAAEPIPEPVEFRPPTEPVSDVPAAEPEPAAPLESEPTPFAEASAPLPEPVDLRPQLPEPEPEPKPEPEPAAAAPDDRDALIDSLHARIEAQEQELAKLREELEQAHAQKAVQVHVWPEDQPPAPTVAPAQTEHYLLCVPTTAGYVLLDRVGSLPSVGQAVEVPEEEGQFTVTKVVRLPRNGRPCAYLQRA